MDQLPLLKRRPRRDGESQPQNNNYDMDHLPEHGILAFRQDNAEVHIAGRGRYRACDTNTTLFSLSKLHRELLHQHVNFPKWLSRINMIARRESKLLGFRDLFTRDQTSQAWGLFAMKLHHFRTHGLALSVFTSFTIAIELNLSSIGTMPFIWMLLFCFPADKHARLYQVCV